MPIAYVALGSNLGDRQALLDQAILRLRAQPSITVTQQSSYYETAPVGGPANQGAYLNAIAEIRTELPADRVLAILLKIEIEFGRVRTVQDAPRTLDLDLILYGDLIRSQPDPILPHPRMHQRSFVLIPFAEIAPKVIHPIFKKSIRVLLEELPKDEDPPRVWQRSLYPNSRELLGKTALITGSSSGIGKAIAIALAQAGANVLVHGREASRDRLEEFTEQLQQYEIRSESIVSSLNDPDVVHHLASQAWERFGSIDILINNAGADTLTGEAAKWSFERKLEELLAVDLRATMLLSRDLGELMKAGQGGVILTTGWDQSETGMEGDSGQLFAATKAAIMAFTKSLALSLAPKVRVNCLAPGWIKTAWGEIASETWQNRVQRETPLQRWGLPEDVAAAARWLCSPAAAFQTGQIVRVNGGVV
jgi:3-oxoacyl-[acyl-carrier protein] reductase